MRQNSELRKAKRLNYRGTMLFEDESSRYYCYAQENNLSGEGMYFESEIALEPGKEIAIRLDNPPFKAAPKNYRAVVQWCRLVSETEYIDSYGVCVKYK